MRLSDAEWKVMISLWERHPASAAEIRERLRGETTWAYTTVKTLLSRLARKNAVGVEKRGNASLYAPLLSRDDARISAVRSLIDRAFAGSSLPFINHLVEHERLSPADREQLARLLAEAKEERP